MEQEQQSDLTRGVEDQEQQEREEPEMCIRVDPEEQGSFACVESELEPQAESLQERAEQELGSEEQQEVHIGGERDKDDVEKEAAPEEEGKPGGQPGGEPEESPVTVEEHKEEVVLDEPVLAPEREADETPEPEKQPEAKLEKQEEPESKEQEKPTEEQASETMEAPSVAEGSLSFPFLEEEPVVAFFRSSQTLFILRGLPGSGKTRLASAINESYEGLCTIISADDHCVKPEKHAASVEALKALDGALVECCTSGKAIVVVDDTNHTHARLARLGELAEEHQYLALYLEPRTGWSRDVEQLSKKTRRGLSKSQIQALLGPLVESSLPLFFGWFLSSAYQEQLRSMASDFLKSLGALEAFKEHMSDFSGEAGKEVDLEQYFSDKGVLHCTTKFCDYGRAQGAKEYAEKQTVRDTYGSVTTLSLTALFITPRTAGAQVSLSQEQLQLWPDDAEKEVKPDADLPAGSRAHITLGCSEGVEPVQTGVDLLEVVLLQQQGVKGEQVEGLDLGPLTYYGRGMWMLSLSEPLCAPACFSSYYGTKKGDNGKEPEKKKKLKCTMM